MTKKPTILITGGAGYIGSQVNLDLQEAGFDTLVIDNLSTGNKEAVIKGTFIFGDLSNTQLLDTIFSEHAIDGIIHFAASTHVGQSVKHPSEYYRNNVINTYLLLEAMKKAGVHRIIFSSTAAVYGIPEKGELFEDSLCHPINPYGESKWIVEKMLKDYFTAYGIQSCSLRYFNAAGGDPQNRLPYYPKKEGNLIPILLHSILTDEPVSVFGTDYPTKDGTCIRDYIHIADLSQAHLLALNKLFNSKDSFCYNLGNNKGYSVLEVIQAAEGVTGKKIRVVKDARRPGDPPILLANATKAHRELGWIPKYPDIKEMIKHAWLSCKT